MLILPECTEAYYVHSTLKQAEHKFFKVTLTSQLPLLRPQDPPGYQWSLLYVVALDRMGRLQFVRYL